MAGMLAGRYAAMDMTLSLVTPLIADVENRRVARKSVARTAEDCDLFTPGAY